MAAATGRPGALVIALDVEAHWGLRDLGPVTGRFGARLRGDRAATDALLALFRDHDIRATWAIVGLLFAADREEAARFRPALVPAYQKSALFPYDETVGDAEDTDPYHYAGSVVDRIAAEPGQEVASHTFSHYYCLEAGQDDAMFAADLDSAVAIARHHEVRLRSLVLPRNQLNPAYADVLASRGFRAYRGSQPGWPYVPTPTDGQRPWRRAGRLADSYLPAVPAPAFRWDDVLADGGRLANVRATRYLRPYLPKLRHFDPLRLRRLTRELTVAAEHGHLVHLWWHPWDFGTHLGENLRFLGQVLERFERLRTTSGMVSLTMADVAAEVMPEPGNGVEP
jgi:peptidoglycan/xylan/chitin deacetylase (PgdA/CDA1 family)